MTSDGGAGPARLPTAAEGGATSPGPPADTAAGVAEEDGGPASVPASAWGTGAFAPALAPRAARAPARETRAVRDRGSCGACAVIESSPCAAPAAPADASAEEGAASWLTAALRGGGVGSRSASRRRRGSCGVGGPAAATGAAARGSAPEESTASCGAADTGAGAAPRTSTPARRCSATDSTRARESGFV